MLSIDDPVVRDVLETAEFWLAYYWNDSCYGDSDLDPNASLPDDADEVDPPTLSTFSILADPIDLNLSDSTSLLLTYKFETTLLIRDTDLAQPAVLAHFGPHEFPILFRWPETLSIAQSVAARTRPTLRGRVLLLLALFTPLTPDDDAKGVLDELYRAWQELGLLSQAQVAKLVGFAPYSEPFRWVNNGGRWVLNEDTYTYRDLRNDTFPWLAFERLFPKTAGDAP